jgi:hypothetical protein
MNNEFDHEYEFPNIADKINEGKFCYISYNSYNENLKRPFRIANNNSQLIVNPDFEEVNALFADLTDIATAVYVADRLTKRKQHKTERILVELPIRSRELHTRASLHEELRDLLYWFTEDLWSFQFSPYINNDPSQQPLPWELDYYPRRVALWSGGLDALAGLYRQLKQNPTLHYTLFGTGGNNMAIGKQKNIYHDMKQLFPGRLKLIQIPLQMHKLGLQSDSSSRARGFVFLLLGAICALQEKQQTLYIHENGIGAINLPFRDCEIGLDHSRSVHPLSLSRMSKFLTAIVGKAFSFENPFLFETKARICDPLLLEQPELAFCSMSCDSWHRRTPPQCGYCSSCLLRRQAIAALQVEDKTPYQINASSGREKQHTDGVEFMAMQTQAATLHTLLKETDPWTSMVKQYPILDEIVQDNAEDAHIDQEITKEHLLHLYMDYAAEWEQVGSFLQQGLPTKLPIYRTKTHLEKLENADPSL